MLGPRQLPFIFPVPNRAAQHIYDASYGKWKEHRVGSPWVSADKEGRAVGQTHLGSGGKQMDRRMVAFPGERTGECSQGAWVPDMT